MPAARVTGSGSSIRASPARARALAARVRAARAHHEDRQAMTAAAYRELLAGKEPTPR